MSVIIRVLYVTHVSELGGAEQSLVGLVATLDRSRFEPHVALPCASGPLGSRLASAGAVLHEVRDLGVLSPRIPSSLVRLARGRRQLLEAAQALAPVLVHANGDVAMAYAAPLRGRSGLKVVWHIRDMRQLGPAGRLIVGRADARIAVSHAALACYGPDPSGTDAVIHNGVDLTRFRPGLPRDATRDELGIPRDAVVCLCVGQDVPWKRLDRFRRLTGQGYRRVLVTYPSPGRSGRGRPCSDRGLVVLPYRDDIEVVYAAADVLVHPAVGEAFGRVVVEAMACGLPVVATGIGGPAEIVVDGECGLLVPPDDQQALERAVGRLVTDAGLRDRMSKAALARAAEFSVAKHTASVQEFYLRLAT